MSRYRSSSGQVSVGRVATAFVVLVLAMSGLLFRLVDVQASPDERIRKEVFIPLGVVTVPGPRGDILDRNGRTIALSLPAATIVADPRLVTDAAGTAQALSGVLNMSVEQLLPKLQRDSAFSYITRQADREVGEQVMSLGLSGIDLIEEPRREHPNGACSGLSTVGRVNIDHVGMSGLEEIYDDHLAGTEGRIVKEVGSDGTTIPGGMQQVTEAEPGSDLALTLDRNIQYQTEQILLEAVADSNAAQAVAIVSIPSTGEIVAMANINRGSDGIVRCTRENLATTWVYEPGSVFKPVTMIAALENDVLFEDSVVTVPSTLRVSRHQFEDTPWHEEVEWSPSEILTVSSNVGTITIAQLVGEEDLYSMIKRLGFGTSTRVGLKGEPNGLLLPLDDWSALTLPNLAIGQGLAVTPLQLVQAYNTFANGGVRVPLNIVAGEERENNGESVRVMREANADVLMRMLTSVVDFGTGKKAYVPGFEMAGKTGTAWQPCDRGYACVNERGEFAGRHHTATFAGIVSNDDGPALVVLVVVDEPKGERYSGGRLAAPVVSQIAEYSLRQLRIPVISTTEPGQRRRAQHVPESALVLATETETGAETNNADN